MNGIHKPTILCPACGKEIYLWAVAYSSQCPDCQVGLNSDGTPAWEPSVVFLAQVGAHECVQVRLLYRMVEDYKNDRMFLAIRFLHTAEDMDERLQTAELERVISLKYARIQ